MFRGALEPVPIVPHVSAPNLLGFFIGVGAENQNVAPEISGTWSVPSLFGYLDVYLFQPLCLAADHL